MNIQDYNIRQHGYGFNIEQEGEKVCSFWTVTYNQIQREKIDCIKSCILQSDKEGRMCRVKDTEEYTFKVSDFVEILIETKKGKMKFDSGKITEILFDPFDEKMPLSVQVDWYKEGRFLYSNQKPIHVLCLNKRLDLLP